MAVQGFFSPDRKTRMAGEKENNAAFSVKVKPVTLANNNTLSLTSGYANPELQPDSGQIVYLENRKPIARASDQTEDIKLIIEF